jgi:hypothetical protein
MLAPDPANATPLQEWITTARAADLPSVHAFTRSLDLDIRAAIAALTMPFHNRRTEGVNTKTKMIKRQMYGRAAFALLLPLHPARLTERHHRKCDRAVVFPAPGGECGNDEQVLSSAWPSLCKL